MKHLLLAASALLTLTAPATAAVVVPLPLVGVVGPVGLVVLAVGYGVVLLVQKSR